MSMNTIPGMPCINHDHYDIDGICVERFTTAPKDAAQRPPPPGTGAALAALYGATYQLELAHGHNVLLGDGARRIAEDVIAWVVGRLARKGPRLY
jgi:hypothetical protein